MNTTLYTKEVDLQTWGKEGVLKCREEEKTQARWIAELGKVL